jgi:predicted CXXCH cytochrome family protein
VRALIRFLTRTAGGATETRERIFEGDTITLGRATDRTLQLKDARVALYHARIYRRRGRILLACSGSSVATVNKNVCRDAQLQTGDVIEIGANKLEIIAPPEGFDLAFTFELAAWASVEDAVAEPRRLALAELGLYKRRLAWILFIVCLGLGLIIPMWGAMRAGGSETLRARKLPSDQLWSPGPLHSAHSMLQAKCESCHQKPFVQVKSEACLECHAPTLHSHIPQRVSAGFAPNLERCTSCHSEHQKPSMLVQTDQRLCAECHGAEARPAIPSVVQGPITRGADKPQPPTLSASAPRAITRATDFLKDHPDFDRQSLEAPVGKSPDTGLMFPHDVHLDPKGIETPDGGTVMKCGDCHQPETGSRRMRPIRMEQHCARCHRLDFDPADPQRQAPHGDPDAVIVSLTEYYSSRYLAGNPDTHGWARPDREVRLPSLTPSTQERDRAIGLARPRAEAAARDLFERRACADCHVVSRKGSKSEPRWKVEPVHLTSLWMPKARFDHSRHGTALTPCTTCHDAGRSSRASDVLMPSIETCRECHGGEPQEAVSSSGRIDSTCAMCHDFHATRNPLWVAGTIAGKQEHTDEGQ